MMAPISKHWDDARKGKEDEYFEKKDADLLRKLVSKHGPLKSPVSGELLESVDLGGVTVYRCPTSGGVWIESDAISKLLETDATQDAGINWLAQFFHCLLEEKVEEPAQFA